MAQFGFVGPSYQSQAVNADCQICRNWYLEVMEDASSKTRRALYPTPGLKLFSSLPGMAKVWEELWFSGRLFAVAERHSAPSAQVLFEVFADGTSVSRGDLGAIGSKPSFAVNNANQLMVASGGRLFLLNLLTNALSEIDTTTGVAVQGAVSHIAFDDSYFVALLKNSQKFQISGLLDGSAWDPLDVAQIQRFPDNVLGMIVDHREIVFWGEKQSVVYFNSGNPDFPFEPVPGAFVEQGMVAPDSRVKLDNTIYWIGADERGGAMAYKANGYTPGRVSTFAIENEWQGYATTADAIAYSYQDRGHTFWVIYFPTANKTWVYDAATGIWHERQSLGGGAHHSLCHAFAFGKHLVGDWASGSIYEMSAKYLDDAGTLIPRTRRAPHVSADMQWMFHSLMQVDLETGLGPQPPLLDGQGHPRGPQLSLRWSDDSGHTWSNYYTVDCGQAGQFKTRALWRRLGRSRDRVYEISCSDPVPWRIINAYLDASG